MFLRLGYFGFCDRRVIGNHNNVKHPTYKALAELGKACKTMFLRRYLHSLPLRCEIHEGLNVAENWNSANSFILYGRGGEIATNRAEDQEITMLSLHLLQVSLGKSAPPAKSHRK